MSQPISAGQWPRTIQMMLAHRGFIAGLAAGLAFVLAGVVASPAQADPSPAPTAGYGSITLEKLGVCASNIEWGEVPTQIVILRYANASPVTQRYETTISRQDGSWHIDAFESDVPPEGMQSSLENLPGPGDYVISLTGEDGTDQSTKFSTKDCYTTLNPVSGSMVKCSTGGNDGTGVVRFTNPYATSVEATVTLEDWEGNSTPQQTLSAGVGAWSELTFTNLGPAVYWVDVVEGDGTVSGRELTIAPCAVVSPKQVKPTASVAGKAKATTSTAPRTITIVNTGDATGRANVYVWSLSGPTKAGGKTRPVADGKSRGITRNLKPGAYTFRAEGDDGDVTLKFTVGKYKAPKFEVTDKNKGKVKVTATYPVQDIKYRYKNKRGNWSSLRTKKDDVKGGAYVINMKNPYKHRVTTYRVVVVPQQPTAPAYKKEIKIRR